MQPLDCETGPRPRSHNFTLKNKKAPHHQDHGLVRREGDTLLPPRPRSARSGLDLVASLHSLAAALKLARVRDLTLKSHSQCWDCWLGLGTAETRVEREAFVQGSVYNHTRVSLPSSHTHVVVSENRDFGYSHTHIQSYTATHSWIFRSVVHIFEEK